MDVLEECLDMICPMKRSRAYVTLPKKSRDELSYEERVERSIKKMRQSYDQHKISTAKICVIHPCDVPKRRGPAVGAKLKVANKKTSKVKSNAKRAKSTRKNQAKAKTTMTQKITKFYNDNTVFQLSYKERVDLVKQKLEQQVL